MNGFSSDGIDNLKYLNNCFVGRISSPYSIWVKPHRVKAISFNGFCMLINEVLGEATVVTHPFTQGAIESVQSIRVHRVANLDSKG